MSSRRRFRITAPAFPMLLAHCLATLLAAEAFGAAVPVSPEQEIARLARTLRPIPDERWQEIAGQRVGERYTIAKGDTLYDVSKRLFGESRYWPKIWALNNASITNPHLIRPGRLIAFMPGTGNSLPSVSITDAPGGAGGAILRTAATVAANSGPRDEGAPMLVASARSQEWRRLPHQPWEDYNPPPATAEEEIVGVQSRVRSTPKITREVDYYLANAELPKTGDLYAATSPGSMIGSYELVYVKAAEGKEPRIGQVYTITREPLRLRGYLNSSHSAEAYPTLGAVRVLAKRGKLWLARIVSARQPIRRGDFLMTAHRRVRVGAPIAGPRPLKGSLILDRTLSTFFTAQNATGFVDLGSADGVRPGMIFRAYQTFDRGGGVTIEENFVKEADFQVIQSSDHFSIVLALSSVTTIQENAPVTLLTDVSDVGGPGNQGSTGESDSSDADSATAGGDGAAGAPADDGSKTGDGAAGAPPAAEEALPPPPGGAEGDGTVPGMEAPPATPAGAEGAGVPSAPPAPPAPPAPDELDSLNGDDLRPDEERELKQLEDWKQNPATRPDVDLPPPPAGDLPAPGDAPGLDGPVPDAPAPGADPTAPPGPGAETEPEMPPGLDSPAPGAEAAPPAPPPPPPAAGGAEDLPPPPAMEAPAPARGAPAPAGAALTPNSEPGASPAEGDFLPPPPPPPN